MSLMSASLHTHYFTQAVIVTIRLSLLSTGSLARVVGGMSYLKIPETETSSIFAVSICGKIRFGLQWPNSWASKGHSATNFLMIQSKQSILTLTGVIGTLLSLSEVES